MISDPANSSAPQDEKNRPRHKKSNAGAHEILRDNATAMHLFWNAVRSQFACLIVASLNDVFIVASLNVLGLGVHSHEALLFCRR